MQIVTTMPLFYAAFSALSLCFFCGFPPAGRWVNNITANTPKQTYFRIQRICPFRGSPGLSMWLLTPGRAAAPHFENICSMRLSSTCRACSNRNPAASIHSLCRNWHTCLLPAYGWRPVPCVSIPGYP